MLQAESSETFITWRKLLLFFFSRRGDDDDRHRAHSRPGASRSRRRWRVPVAQRSLDALLAQLHFLFAKSAFWRAALALEQLLHQLLPGAAGPRCPQRGALPQAQRAQQPGVVQERSLDQFMCGRGSRRNHGGLMEALIA